MLLLRSCACALLQACLLHRHAPALRVELLRGAGVEPKPTYLPPWLGGRWSGLLAFSSCLRAKKASLLAALVSSCERVYSLPLLKPCPLLAAAGLGPCREAGRRAESGQGWGWGIGGGA